MYHQKLKSNAKFPTTTKWCRRTNIFKGCLLRQIRCPSEISRSYDQRYVDSYDIQLQRIVTLKTDSVGGRRFEFIVWLQLQKKARNTCWWYTNLQKNIKRKKEREISTLEVSSTLRRIFHDNPWTSSNADGAGTTDPFNTVSKVTNNKKGRNS